MMSHFSKETTEEGQYFPDKVVADHLIFLVLAAHDTTTSALTMASYYLARHPEWQERLRGEVLGLDRSLAYDDLGANVPLLEQTFHEILRMHPPVPQLMRRTIRETELGGYRIPADTMVAISPIPPPPAVTVGACSATHPDVDPARGAQDLSTRLRLTNDSSAGTLGECRQLVKRAQQRTQLGVLNLPQKAHQFGDSGRRGTDRSPALI